MGSHVLQLQGAAQGGQMYEIRRKQEGEALWLLKEAKQLNRFLRYGQCAEDSNKIPSKVT